MKLRLIAPRSFASNCYLMISKQQALVVDPSVSLAAITQALHEERAVCQGILLTHGHFDHMLALDEVRQAFPDAPVYIHRDDSDFLADGEKNAFSFFFYQNRTWQPTSHLLTDGDILSLGNEQIEVIHTPGHTPGSVCYRCGSTLLTGDTLFNGGYGRYDLYGGDLNELIRSLRRLSDLPSDLTIYPGHGTDAPLGRALAQTMLL